MFNSLIVHQHTALSHHFKFVINIFPFFLCHIQKKFVDNVFCWKSSISANFFFFLVLIYNVFYTFSHFFLVVYDVLLNRRQGSSLFTWENYQTTTLFFFASFSGTHSIWTISFTVWIWPCLCKKLFFSGSIFTITFLPSAQSSQFPCQHCKFVVLLDKTVSQNELESYKNFYLVRYL